MGRWDTRIDQESEDGGCGSRSSARGDGWHMYMGFVKCHTNIKSGSLKSHLYGLAHFILTQVLWINVKSVKCSSAWMPVARGLKLAMRYRKVKI